MRLTDSPAVRATGFVAAAVLVGAVALAVADRYLTRAVGGAPAGR